MAQDPFIAAWKNDPNFRQRRSLAAQGGRIGLKITEARGRPELLKSQTQLQLAQMKREQFNATLPLTRRSVRDAERKTSLARYQVGFETVRFLWAPLLILLVMVLFVGPFGIKFFSFISGAGWFWIALGILIVYWILR